jgi:hypothetical protein
MTAFVGANNLAGDIILSGECFGMSRFLQTVVRVRLTRIFPMACSQRENLLKQQNLRVISSAPAFYSNTRRFLKLSESSTWAAHPSFNGFTLSFITVRHQSDVVGTYDIRRRKYWVLVHLSPRTCLCHHVWSPLTTSVAEWNWYTNRSRRMRLSISTCVPIPIC